MAKSSEEMEEWNLFIVTEFCRFLSALYIPQRAHVEVFDTPFSAHAEVFDTVFDIDFDKLVIHIV